MYQELEQQEQDIVKGGGTIGPHRLLENWRKDMSKVVVVLSAEALRPPFITTIAYNT